MNRRVMLALWVAMLIVLGACGSDKEEAPPMPTPIATLANTTGDQATTDESAVDTADNDAASSDSNATPGGESGRRQGTGGMGNGGMMGGGMGSDMRERHMLPVPAEYAGLPNPAPVDEASIERGQAHFNQFCASCHGAEGLGDGPAAASLDPAPPMIAQTSLMLGDDFLFWRISEGGAFEPFNSAMPPWKAILDEEARWDVINYARTLSGAEGIEHMGSGPMRAQMQAAMHEEMIAAGIEQGIINEADAETFLRVHDQLDAYRETVETGANANTEAMQDEWLAALVEDGQLSQADADAFADIHDRLEAAGLMP